MPGLHLRMGSEQMRATLMRQLEPPGFLALGYGYQTPVPVIVSNLVFGISLGAFYEF
jgi:hypothetical protein